MAAGAVEIAPRRRLKLREGRLADMAASDLELGYAGVKAYGATAQGEAFVVALFATDRPELVALIGADHLGRLRTGAASGVAAKHLAREGASSLGVFGCGTQAETQVTCIRAAVPTIERVVAYSRTGATSRHSASGSARSRRRATARPQRGRRRHDYELADPVLRGVASAGGPRLRCRSNKRPHAGWTTSSSNARLRLLRLEGAGAGRVRRSDRADSTPSARLARVHELHESCRVSCRERQSRATSSCSSRMESPRGTWRSLPRQSTVRASVALGSRSSCARLRDRGGCPRRSRRRAPGSAPAGRACADDVAG